MTERSRSAGGSADSGSALVARFERAGPLLGEHSAEVLSEIGHSEDEVRAFVARGTVAAA